MTEAMEVLFSYAQDCLESALLLANPQCTESQRCVSGQKKRPRAILDETALKCLDDFFDEQKLLLFF